MLTFFGVELPGNGSQGLLLGEPSFCQHVCAEGSVDVVRQWLSLFEANSKNKWVDDIFVSLSRFCGCCVRGIHGASAAGGEDRRL